MVVGGEGGRQRLKAEEEGDGVAALRAEAEAAEAATGKEGPRGGFDDSGGGGEVVAAGGDGGAGSTATTAAGGGATTTWAACTRRLG